MLTKKTAINGGHSAPSGILDNIKAGAKKVVASVKDKVGKVGAKLKSVFSRSR